MVRDHQHTPKQTANMSVIRKSSPELQGFLSRLKVEALPVIERATVLLLKFPKDKPVPDRSGVLLRIAQEHFIFSCSHNLQKLLAKNVPLCIALPGAETPFVHLIDATFHGTETDHRDIVAIHLSRRAAAELLAAGRVPIEMADISRGDPVQPGLFLLFGYPQEWFDVEPGKLAHPPLIFLAGLYEPGAALIADLACDVRYGMAYNPDFHGLFTMTGNARRTSDWHEIPLLDYNGMKGISGCGVWRLCDATPEAITKWTVDQCKLVAIEHRYDPSNGFVHATWIGIALHRIVADFPHLESAILGE
jgi:hypothetical protein